MSCYHWWDFLLFICLIFVRFEVTSSSARDLGSTQESPLAVSWDNRECWQQDKANLGWPNAKQVQPLYHLCDFHRGFLGLSWELTWMWEMRGIWWPIEKCCNKPSIYFNEKFYKIPLKQINIEIWYVPKVIFAYIYG